jgi:thioredoxin reductase (NADPH)
MNSSTQTREVVILGSGPAGYTAAIYTARANLAPLLAYGPLAGGQLTTTTEVENFPGFAKGIQGPELMEEMRKQAERFGTEFLPRKATKVELDCQPFRIHFDDDIIETKSLIVATGASAKTPGLEREWELMGYGVSTCATCDGAFFKDQEIVVVGGGDSAAEEANFLTKFGKRVRLIHRRDTLRASKIMADRVLKNPKIEVIWNSKITKLIGDRKTGITGCELENVVTAEKSELECAAIFYAIGHTPNSSLFQGQLEMDENGYLITKPNSSITNIPGVFACGDIQDHYYRQAITAAGSGCMAALDCERWLAEVE